MFRRLKTEFSPGFQLRGAAGMRGLICRYAFASNRPDVAIAIVITSSKRPTDGALVRINSACFTSEALGDSTCDCKWQLDDALQRIEDEQNGALIYLLRQEGRGLGLERKMRIMSTAQSKSCSYSSAAIELKWPLDERRYDTAVRIIKALDLVRVRLLTNNPEKLNAVKEAQIIVQRIPILKEPLNTEQTAELAQKKSILGHLVDVG